MTAAIAVVPLRDGTSGKTRLARAMASDDRGLLVAELARHVVATVLDAGVATVVVVTCDPAFVMRTLGRHGDRLLVVEQGDEPGGLNAAVELGREAAWSDRPDHQLLVVHADLPALTSADVRALVTTPTPVVLATDRAGTGTNALVLAAGSDDFRFRFGPGSLAAHRTEAVRLGLADTVVRRTGTSVDLDTAADWLALPAPVRARVRRAVPAMQAIRAHPHPR